MLIELYLYISQIVSNELVCNAFKFECLTHQLQSELILIKTEVSFSSPNFGEIHFSVPRL